MFNSIDNYSFIPVSGCVGMGPSPLFCQGAYNAVWMALNITRICTLNKISV
jgi:hypothetical protein